MAEKKSRNELWKRLFMLVILVSGIVSLFYFTPLNISDFTPSKIKDFILHLGVWGPVVFVLIYASRAVILVIPVGVMSLAGGLAFGQWFGTLYILIGATLGACISFLVARYFGRTFIEQFDWLHKGKIKSFDESSAKHGFKAILFIRLVPLFQYDAVNFGAGLSKIKFKDYALGSLIGMAPGGFINAMLGSSLENIISVQFFVALGLFILLMLIPTFYKLFRRKRGRDIKVPGTSMETGNSQENQSEKHG